MRNATPPPPPRQRDSLRKSAPQHKAKPSSDPRPTLTPPVGPHPASIHDLYCSIVYGGSCDCWLTEEATA